MEGGFCRRPISSLECGDSINRIRWNETNNWKNVQTHGPYCSLTQLWNNEKSFGFGMIKIRWECVMRISISELQRHFVVHVECWFVIWLEKRGIIGATSNKDATIYRFVEWNWKAKRNNNRKLNKRTKMFQLLSHGVTHNTTQSLIRFLRSTAAASSSSSSSSLPFAKPKQATHIVTRTMKKSKSH